MAIRQRVLGLHYIDIVAGIRGNGEVSLSLEGNEIDQWKLLAFFKCGFLTNCVFFFSCKISTVYVK